MVIVPAEPPPPNAGTYSLSLGSNQAIPLTQFGGCFDKEIGVEYEDCYFTTNSFSPALVAWLQDSISNVNNLRTLNIYQLGKGSPIGQIQITGAFVRAFSFSDLSTTPNPNNPGKVSFVIVPATVAGVTTSTPGSLVVPSFLNVRVDIDAVDPAGIAGVAGLQLSWAKLPGTSAGARRAFMPGAMVADNVVINLVAGTTTPNTTTADMELWTTDVAHGTSWPRDATIKILSNLATVFLTVDLTGLVPLQFPLFGTFGASPQQRSMTLRVGSWTVK